MASRTIIRTIEILGYAGAAALALAALVYPTNYPLFWSQSFEFWLTAEFLTIHSVGFISGQARKGKLSTRTKFFLFGFYALLIIAATLTYSQWVLGAIMLSYLLLRVYKAERLPEAAAIDVALQTVVFLFCLFAASFAIHAAGFVFPEYVATSDPLYQSLMNKFWGLVYMMLYYGLLSVVAIGSMFLLRSKQ